MRGRAYGPKLALLTGLLEILAVRLLAPPAKTLAEGRRFALRLERRREFRPRKSATRGTGGSSDLIKLARKPGDK
jgi:hypothetical protein